jgi:hypothetical protein
MIRLDDKMEEIFIDIESFLSFLKSSSLSAIFQTYHSDLQKAFFLQSVKEKPSYTNISLKNELNLVRFSFNKMCEEGL